MWRLPEFPGLEADDDRTIRPNAQRYLDTRAAYQKFGAAMLERMKKVGEAP
jgi:hypothetical protein